MLQRIKNYLYKRKITNSETLLDKIELLQKNPSIYFYSSIYCNTFLNFIEKDIIDYNNVLENILRQGLETKYVSIKNISEQNYYYTSLSFWYSNKTAVLNTNDEFKRFLNNIHTYISWYEKNKTEVVNVNINNNIRRTKPYYYNIELIVNTIIENELKNIT